MELNGIDFAPVNQTNCLTYVPQDIKLTLESGVLTLKAGSKVYVPNGFETNGTTPKFDEVVIEEDVVNTDLGTSTSTPDIWFVNTTNNSLTGWPTNICFSGSDKSTIPDSTVWAIYYETSTNKIWTRTNSTTWMSVNHSFPIGLGFNENTHTVDRIEKIFNGSGYIGNTVFILPGVRGLCPDGFDENGNNKNIEIKATKIITDTLSPNTIWNGHKFYYVFRPNNVADPYLETQFTYFRPTSTYTGYYFNKIENKWYWYASGALTGQIYPIFISSFMITSTATTLSISAYRNLNVFQAENTENISEDYSFGETFTGKYFVNGKKIYQITVIGTTPSTDGNWTSVAIPSGIQVAWIKDGFIQGSNGYFYPIVVYNDGSPIGESFVQINPSTPAVAILVKGSYLRSNPFYLTINYTKFSDT